MSTAEGRGKAVGYQGLTGSWRPFEGNIEHLLGLAAASLDRGEIT